MKKMNILSNLRRFSLVTLAAVSLAGIAQAAPLYKINTTDNLNTTNSWSTNSGAQTPNPDALTSTDKWYINEATMLGSKTVSLGGDITIGGMALDWVTANSANDLTINAGNTLAISGTTLYGSGAEGAGGTYTSAGIVLNRGTGGALTINCDITLGAAQTWVTSRPLTVTGNITNAGFLLSVNTATTTAPLFTGLIVGTGGLTKQGSGTLTLSNNASAFSGPLIVAGGTLSVTKLSTIGNSSSIGTGSSTSTINLNGGTLTYTGTGDTTDRGITMQASAAINNNSAANGSLVFTAPAVIQAGTASARTLTLGGSSTGTNIFALILTNSGTGAAISSLAKTGASVWALTNAQTYSGFTSISQGILQLNGAGVLGGTAGSTADSSNIVFTSTSANGTLEFPTVASLGAASQVRFRNTGGTAGTGGTLKYVGTAAETLSKTFQCDSSIGIRLASDSVGGSLTYNGAISDNGARPIYLDGTGVGANTYQTNIVGTRTVTKNGAGTWILSGTNTYTGITTINAGTLALSGGFAMADSNAVTFASWSGAAPTLKLNANETIGSIAGGGGDGVVDLGANTLTLSGTNNTTYDGILSGTGGSLTKIGSGTNTLTGISTYTGPTTISAGTLEVNGSLAAGSAVAVATNTTLSGIGTVYGPVTVSAGGRVASSGTLTVGSLNLTGVASINVNPGLGGLLVVSGTDGLTNNGANSVTINLPTTQILGAGTHHLIQYSGSLKGTGFSAFKLGTTPPGASYSLANNAGYVDLVVVAAELWTGLLSSEWSTNTLANPKNWTFQTIAADYTNGMPAIFDDTAYLGTNVVDISVADVTPTSVYVNNSSIPYTFQGIAGITGSASLVKDGYSTLTVVNNNNYSGGTTIALGTVQIGTNGTAGAIAGDIVNNAALVLSRADNVTVSGNISGTGTLNNGGAGTVTLSGANTYSGQTTLSTGSLKAGSATGLSPNSTVSTTTGMTLDLAGYTSTVGGVDGAGTVTNSGAAATLTTAHSSALTLSGQIVDGTGATTLVKDGSGTFTLTGSNTYSGGTFVKAGTLFVGDQATSGSIVGNVGVSNSATFRIGRSDTVTFSGIISGAGNGSFWGPGTVILSGANTWTGGTAVGGSGSGTLETTATSQIGTGQLNLNSVVGATVRLRSNQTVSEIMNGAVGSVLDITNTTLTVNSPSGAAANILNTTFVSPGGALVLRGGTNTIMNADGSQGVSGNFTIFGVPMDPTTKFALDTGSSAENRKDYGFIADGVTNYLSSLTGYGAIRNDANGNTNGPVFRTFIVDQATDTTFNGALLSHASSHTPTNYIRNVALVKQGSGKLTLAGFVGKQTVSAGGAASVVNLTVAAGTLDITNPANGTNSASGNVGTNLVSGGTLSFAANALGKGGAATIVMNGGKLFWNAGNSQDVSSQLLLNDGITGLLDTGANSVALTNALGVGAAKSAALTKLGSGTLALGGTNLYQGATTVSNGTLLVNGSLDSASAVTVNSGATFGGAGTAGTVTVNGVLSPGASIGTLSLTAPPTLNGETYMEISPANTNFDQVAVTGNITYGGTLVVTNIGDQSFVSGSVFKLFSSSTATYGGAFSSITLPALPSPLTWTTNLLVDGSIVVAGGVSLPTTPTNITFSVSGSQAHLSWPQSYTGWNLQTNSVNVASTNDWHTLSDATATNEMFLNIDPTKTNVFFRLRYPN